MPRAWSLGWIGEHGFAERLVAGPKPLPRELGELARVPGAAIKDAPSVRRGAAR
jgi:hypothetical protein